MPSRGKYEVTSQEEGKVAVRDQSYKSCILSMLIFILLCVVLILASLPWKKFQTQHDRSVHDEDLIEFAGRKGVRLTTNSNDKSAKIYAIETTRETSQETLTVREDNFQTTMKVTHSVTQGDLPSSVDENNGESSDGNEDLFTTTFATVVEPEIVEIYEESSTPEEPSTPEVSKASVKSHQDSTTISETTTDPVNDSTWLRKLLVAKYFGNETTAMDNEESTGDWVEGAQTSENKFTTTLATSAEAIGEIYENSSAFEDSRTSPKNTEDPAGVSGMTTDSVGDFTSLRKLLVAKYFGNETTTLKDEEWFAGTQSSTDKEQIEISAASLTKTILPSSSVEISTNSATESTPRNETTENKVSTTVRNPVEPATSQNSRKIRDNEIDRCQTGNCKHLASKMLSYMNHSVDPCEDFYEYACGGLETDEQINEKNLLRRIYEKIEKQAREKQHSGRAQFIDYYESCLKYDNNFDHFHRVNLAKEAVENVGKFYTRSNWPGDFQGFTTLFANMILNNRPLLFDIVPDVNEKNSETFILKIGPAIDQNPFRSMHTQDLCKDLALENLSEYVDLGQLYETYINCKNDTTVIVSSVSQALKDIEIFEKVDNTSDVHLYLEDTLTIVSHEIIEGVMKYFPSDSEIQESYRSKQYTVTTVRELEDTCTFLNWTQLVQSLTGVTPEPNTELQIYYKNELTWALRHLEDFRRTNELGLNNALLSLYARNLYQDLVSTRSTRNLETRCFDVAVHFMQAEASVLYLSSFTDDEIHKMKTLMQNTFHELKQTLKFEIEESEWAVEWGRQVLLKKLDDVKMSIPDVSYINSDYTYKLIITDDYFNNSMTLMKKYRSMMYSVLQKNPNDPEQIWTFFASPYQSDPRTIYGPNLILIPFGAIDWSLLSGNFGNFEYIRFATMGNIIAREIAHNFDANGIRYWNGSRDSEFALMTDKDLTKMNYEDYLNCQRDSMYHEPVEIILPSTGQQLKFMVPSLTLNDRLSDAVGMRLAHDTLVRLSKESSEELLPWLDLSANQLFYLIYAQTYCTKTSLIASYVSLNESPLLPGRIRVFAAASNNKNLGKSWKCYDGSPLLPEFTCDVFPHLEYRGDMPDAA